MPELFTDPATVPDPAELLHEVRANAGKRTLRRTGAAVTAGLLAVAVSSVGAAVTLRISHGGDRAVVTIATPSSSMPTSALSTPPLSTRSTAPTKSPTTVPADTAGASFSGTPGPNLFTPATDVVDYEPFNSDASIASGLTVTASTTGLCNPSSVSVRDDAYDCAATPDRYSPCFSSPVSGRPLLACPDLADSSHVVTVTPTNILDVHAPPTYNVGLYPWLIRVVDGEYCEFISGATGIEDGLRLNYSCPSAVVFGFPSGPATHETVIYETG